MFANLYKCPNCGPTWHVYEYENIDCERDDIEITIHCSDCHAWVQPITKNDLQVVHALTDEEMFWELGGGYDVEENDF